jgi:hypothetical protein
LRFGDVVHHDGRYWIVLSCDRYNADTACASVFVARGTQHTKSDEVPIFGEMPVLYPDPRQERLFPNAFRFNYSFFQTHEIRPLLKASLLPPTKSRILGHCYPPCLLSLRVQLDTLWWGYEGPLPRERPRKDPCFSRIRRGVTIHISSEEPHPSCLVISDETVHEWYPAEALIVVPIRNAHAKSIADKYFVQGMHGMNIYFAKADYENRYGRGSKFAIDIESKAAPASEVEELLELYRLIFGSGESQ